MCVVVYYTDADTKEHKCGMDIYKEPGEGQALCCWKLV